MKIAAIVYDSIVDGPGHRITVFAIHDSTTEISSEDISNAFLENESLVGITFKGDDPFDQALECARLAIEAKHLNSDYTVWIFTSYTYEELIKEDNYEKNLLLSVTDVLVDGPFIESLKSDKYDFTLSTNQRIINVPRSMREHRVVECNP